VSPLEVFFAVPDSGAAPVIDSVNGSTSGFTSFVNRGTFDSGSLYSFFGCTSGCNASVNFGNMVGALLANHLPSVSDFTVYETTITSTLGPKADFAVDGHFMNGTFVAPLGVTTGGKTFDTSFTNLGMVDASNAIPETSTWVMMLTGFGLMGLAAGLRKRRSNRIAAFA
jgi:hypothetical protein